MWLCIIVLKHEVVASDEWHYSGPQDLVTVCLCIQIFIEVSIFPLKSVTTPNGSQVKTLVRKMSMQMSFPETVSD